MSRDDRSDLALALFVLLGSLAWNMAVGCHGPQRGPCGYGNGWYTGPDGKVRCVEVKP